jgi:hypothetical protein
VNTLTSANQFVYVKTPIRYTQRTLCILEYTQTVPRGRLWDTHDPQQILCDMKCTFVSHKNGSATPVTDNARTWPAAGPAVCGAGDGVGFANDPALVRAWKRYPAYKDSGVEFPYYGIEFVGTSAMYYTSPQRPQMSAGHSPA